MTSNENKENIDVLLVGASLETLQWAIIIFILFTYLGWFGWHKDTGLKMFIKAFIQFILSCIIGFTIGVNLAFLRLFSGDHYPTS
tara:strand:- start:389 stop:643 length:255 start_codon:yes stop_codon:yes gene_type:complete